MHFDLAHALVSAVLVFGILQLAKRLGWEGFDWRSFGLIFGAGCPSHEKKGARSVFKKGPFRSRQHGFS